MESACPNDLYKNNIIWSKRVFKIGPNGSYPYATMLRINNIGCRSVNFEYAGVCENHTDLGLRCQGSVLSYCAAVKLYANMFKSNFVSSISA